MDENKKIGDKDGQESGASEAKNADTSAVQDLFDSMGIGLWRRKKNDGTEELYVPPGEKPNIDEVKIHEVQNNSFIEINEEDPKSVAEENQGSAENADFYKEIVQEEEGILEEDIGISTETAKVMEKEPVKKGLRRKLFALSAVILVAFFGYKEVRQKKQNKQHKRYIINRSHTSIPLFSK